MKKTICLFGLLFMFWMVLHSQITSEGLVGYWPFSHNANDESGNNNHGSVNGAKLSTDRSGNENSCYYFDGIDDYIKAPADSLPTAERTVCFWFLLESTDNAPTPLAYGGGGYGLSWFMCINHTEKPNSLHLEAHANKNELDYFYDEAPLNVWSHWVISTNETGTKMYFNSKLVAENETYVSNTGVAGTFLGIGVCCNANGQVPYTDANVGYFKGKLDEVRIYNRALDQDEINAIYGGEYTILKPVVLNKDVRIFPNPSTGQFNITWQNQYDSSLLFKVYDMKGQLIHIEKTGSGLKQLEMNLEQINSGLFLIEIIDLKSRDIVSRSKVSVIK